jgi:hypothetical protein
VVSAGVGNGGVEAHSFALLFLIGTACSAAGVESI